MATKGSTQAVRVVDYDPEWPNRFAELRERIWPAVADFALAIEHVGSTSVPGLAAQSIVDVDVVIPSPEELPVAAARLWRLGYRHEGDLGVKDLEVFNPPASLPAHRLYVCSSESAALRGHLGFRDLLRADAGLAEAYVALKKDLEGRYKDDAQRYMAAKSEFILSVLAGHGFSESAIGAMRASHQKLSS